MAEPTLLSLYDLLPPLRPGDDEDLWAAGAQDGLRAFRDAVQEKYTEGTLQRLLLAGDLPARRAAALALGLVGTMASNRAVAAGLHDPDGVVRRFAGDACWEVWFRGGTAEQATALRAAARNPDPAAAKRAFDGLVRVAPEYAEAYNQRAIWFFHRGAFARAVEDCETVLRLNPYHYGAAAGMGQCLQKMGKPKGAVRAFRRALEINPELTHLHETIRTLEDPAGD